jgi:tetratricopeptide (TPR) repeat protein
VEGNYGTVTQDWATAAESYRTLFALFPDHLDYGLRLIQAQDSLANVRDAQATLDALRKLPPPATDDPRIDLAEVGIAWQRADAKRVLAAASRASAKAETQGAHLLQAKARRHQGAAWRRLGDNAKALANYENALQLYTAAGDRAGAAGILRDIADTTAEQGDYSAAMELYRRSLAVAREIGNAGGEAADLNNIAVVLENRRDFAGAEKMYARALAKFREVDNKQQAAISLGNVGEVLFYQGDLAAAERRIRQAIDAAHQIGDVDNEAYQLSNLALLLQTRGDLSAAKSTFEKALSLWGDSDLHASSAAIVQLGEVQLAQDDLAGARKSQEQALAMRQKLGEQGSIAESHLAISALLLEEGHPTDAEASARQAGAEFHTEKIADQEAIACALQARAQMEQGSSHFRDALKTADRAVLLAAKTQAPMIRLSVAVIAAQVEVGAIGNSAAAKSASVASLRKLRSIQSEARKFGFLGLELESQLVMGQMEMNYGGRDAGRSRLANVEKTASTKGYALIARKAAAAVK